MQNRPAVRLVLVIITGTLLGNQTSLPLVPLLFISIVLLSAVLLLFFFKFRNPLCINLFLALALLFIAALNYRVKFDVFSASHIANFLHFREPLLLEGVIVEDPDIYDNGLRLTVETKKLQGSFGSIHTHGKVLVTLRNVQRDFHYGDRLLIHGRLRKPSGERNPGQFNYEMYLKRRGVYGIISVYKENKIKVIGTGEGKWFYARIVYPVKHYLTGLVDGTISGEQAALLKGLLVGERGEIPEELRESFAKSGVIHVLAVSGLHVGFVSLILLSLFTLLRIPYRINVILTIGGLILYALVTELRPPVTRATVMATVILLATIFERRIDIYNTLAVAAVAVLVIKPGDLFSVGFQLSFVAVFSIVYFFDRLRKLFFKRGLPERLDSLFFRKFLIAAFFISLAAQLGTLPITAYYFNRIPLISLVANLLVVPLVGAIIALGFASAIFGVFSLGLARIYAAASGFISGILIKMVKWAGALPFAYVHYPRPKWIHLAVYYVGVVLLVNLRSPQVRKKFLMFVLLILNLFVWTHATSHTGDYLRVIFFDVGQGDAALLRFPNGENILIDGGGQTYNFDAGESIIVPYLRREGIKELDLVCLSHPHNDHLGGLPYILENINVSEIVDNGGDFDSHVFQEYKRAIEKSGIKHRILRAGDIIHSDNFIILILHPTEKFMRDFGSENTVINNGSLVLKVIYGKTSFLFMGDVEREAEEALLRYQDMLKSDVIKIAHHGSETSTTLRFIKEVHPHYAIISVGKYNNLNQPSDIVLNRLRLQNVSVLRTDTNGAVIFKTDGVKLERVR